MNFFRVDTFGVSLLASAIVLHAVFFATLSVIADTPLRFTLDAFAGFVFFFFWLILPYMLMAFAWPSEDRMRAPWSRITAGVLIVGLALVLWSGFIWDIYQHRARVEREGPARVFQEYDPSADSNNMTPALLPFLQLQIIGIVFICSYGLGKTNTPARRPERGKAKW